MQREVVQDFLNLPGIEGVALVDGRSRPYFCGVDQTLNFQQKEALAQGIQQVVETTPPDFEFFEFQFTGHQVYIYKLDHGVILLVLTSDHLIYPSYVRAVEKLKLELQDDITNAIATFRLLAGNITLSGHHYWKRDGSSSQGGVKSPQERSGAYQNGKQPRPEAPPPITPTEPVAAPTQQPEPAPPPPPETVPEPVPEPPPLPRLTLEDVVKGLNEISQFTKQYLGATVVSNYWKSSRPSADWLTKFEVDRAGAWTFMGGSMEGALTAEQEAWIKQWIAAFSKRCSIVIRDYPTLLQQSQMGDRLKDALLPN